MIEARTVKRTAYITKRRAGDRLGDKSRIGNMISNREKASTDDDIFVE